APPTAPPSPPPSRMPPEAGPQAHHPASRMIAYVDPTDSTHLLVEQTPSPRDRWRPQGQVDRERLAEWSRFDADWHLSHAIRAEETGEAYAAEHHLQQLLRHQPWDAPAHVRLAHLYASQGQRDKSALHLTRALLLNPRVSLWPS